MKKLIIVFFLLSPELILAQLTSVTGTVIDAAGQHWNNGIYKVDFVRNADKVGIIPKFNGLSFKEHYDIQSLDVAATFTISLQPVTSITPSGGTWRFTFCPNATVTCRRIDVGVTGAIMDLTAQITASIGSPMLNGSPVLNKAYSDAELRVGQYNPNSQATLYYDVTLNCIKYFNGVIWQCVGGGGGPFTQVQSDWTETNVTLPDYILHKPTIYYQQVGINSAPTFPQEGILNIIAGDRVTVTGNDDPLLNRTDIIIDTPQKHHAISFTIGSEGGTAFTAGDSVTDYITVPLNFTTCTIRNYALIIDAGTITVKFWRVNGGTAKPTSANSISTSGVGVAAGTAISSTVVTDFTSLAIAANDRLAMNVFAASGSAYVNGVLGCDE